MTNYVVGDIQGCYDPLQRLLEKLRFDPTRDRLWAVGDMVNRGRQSLLTLRLLKSLGSAFTGILGNHDLHFLALACGAFTGSKKHTMGDLLAAPDCHELFEWVRSLPLAHKEMALTPDGEKKVLLVHAGIAPQWTFREALASAREVHAWLRGPHYKDYLRAMYGDEPDSLSESLEGLKRLRVITNILTRMRFCDASGRMDLKAKEGLESAPSGMLPWYEYVSIKPNRLLLFGHWAALQGRTGKPNVMALDTGCVWGNCLTALQLDTYERIKVSCDAG